TALAPPALYALSLHDALPICELPDSRVHLVGRRALGRREQQVMHQLRGLASHRHGPLRMTAILVEVEVPVFHERLLEPLLLKLRSEEHTSELQSPYDLVCRLL